MKNLEIIKNRQPFLFACFIAVFALSSGCKKDHNTAPSTKKVTVQLSGANEVPAVNTGGTGTVVINFDPALKTIAYQVTWQLGSDTAHTTGMHFHGSANGSSATSSPIAIPVTGFATASSGTLSVTTQALTQTQVDELLAGKWYFNIHSSKYPGGEIRGNIIFQGTTVINNTSDPGNNNYPY